jgi:D-glycero-D-manno-heptose 1,7-bisphosphate phosphatase
LPSVDTAIDRLKADGFKIIVVTKQPDVAAGVQKLSVVDEIRESLHASLGIDEIYTCYHVGADNYDCRTHKPGVLVAAAKKHNIDLSRSFLVGDRWRDIHAGNAVGCHTHFIDFDYKEFLSTAPNRIVASQEKASMGIVENMSLDR